MTTSRGRHKGEAADGARLYPQRLPSVTWNVAPHVTYRPDSGVRAASLTTIFISSARDALVGQSQRRSLAPDIIMLPVVTRIPRPTT
jgi:hypothetical protein